MIGIFLLFLLLLLLGLSYTKGKHLLEQVVVIFNNEREIYRQGEKFFLKIETTRQKIFESREIFVEMELTSVMNEQTYKHQERLLLQRKEDGCVSIEFELNQCDLITIEIKRLFIYDLCGCFRFQKNVSFYQSILVFPQEFPIENGEISTSIEEYGNIRLFGEENTATWMEPVIYLDLKNLRKEKNSSVRKNYLTVFYSISAALLLHQYRQHIQIGEEEFHIFDWEDYYEIFLRIFEILRGSFPVAEEDFFCLGGVSHKITTKEGIVDEDYEGKTIAVVASAKDIEQFFPMTEYVIVENLQEDLFYLSL